MPSQQVRQYSYKSLLSVEAVFFHFNLDDPVKLAQKRLLDMRGISRFSRSIVASRTDVNLSDTGLL